MTDKIEYMGNCYPERRGGEAEAQEGAVYGTEGISPSIVATSYKGTMPKIITDDMQDKQVTTCAIRGRGESGNLHQTVEQGGEVANAVTTSHKDSMVMEVIGSTQKNAFQGSVDGVSPTLTEAMGMGGGQIPMVKEVGNRQPKILTEEEGRQQALNEVLDSVNGKRFGRASAVLEEDGTIRGIDTTKKSSLSECAVQNEGNTAQTIITAHQPKVYGKTTKYRIRRLTPRECYRLMNVDEEDIDKIYASGISETRMYATAGNSIVVACLYHLFRKLFVETDCEERQLTLF